MIKYFSKQVIGVMCLSFSSSLLLTGVIAYFENRDYPLICLIFWSLLVFPFTFIHLCPAVGVAFVCIAFSLYLKFQFKETNEQILNCLKTQNTRLLLKSISKHIFVTKTTHQINNFYKRLIGVLYFMLTPLLVLFLFLSYEKDSIFLFRAVVAMFFVSCFSLLFLMNYLCGSVTKTAHKSLPVLHKYLIETKISLNEKLKIMSTIERLSGPDIGFYCFDLFPMNNYHFYRYFCNFFVLYFLMIGLI